MNVLPSARATHRMSGVPAFWFLSICILAIFMAWIDPAAVRADFAVRYKAKSATLVIFNQPQGSPFSALSARLLIKGDRMRVEATDHWGRNHIWISDRSTQITWRLLENKEYVTEAGGWSCENVPAEVIGALASGLAEAGIDSLSISSPVVGQWESEKAQVTQWAFRAHAFGLPKPIWVQASVYFPMQEATHFGASVNELYCGKKPAESQWQAALTGYLHLPQANAAALAHVAALPIAMDMRSDLGMGTATLVLEATDISTAPLDASLFRLPDGYHPAATSE